MTPKISFAALSAACSTLESVTCRSLLRGFYHLPREAMEDMPLETVLGFAVYEWLAHLGGHFSSPALAIVMAELRADLAATAASLASASAEEPAMGILVVGDGRYLASDSWGRGYYDVKELCFETGSDQTEENPIDQAVSAYCLNLPSLWRRTIERIRRFSPSPEAKEATNG